MGRLHFPFCKLGLVVSTLSSPGGVSACGWIFISSAMAFILSCVLCLGRLLYLTSAMGLRLKPLSNIHTQDAVSRVAKSGGLQESHGSQCRRGCISEERACPPIGSHPSSSPPPFRPCDTEGWSDQLDFLKPLGWGGGHMTSKPSHLRGALVLESLPAGPGVPYHPPGPLSQHPCHPPSVSRNMFKMHRMETESPRL